MGGGSRPVSGGMDMGKETIGFGAGDLLKNRDAIAGLANSEDARRLMELLGQQGGGVRQAAQAAAAGSPQQLMEMMDRLMNSKEGADLVARIGDQARKAGLE